MRTGTNEYDVWPAQPARRIRATSGDGLSSSPKRCPPPGARARRRLVVIHRACCPPSHRCCCSLPALCVSCIEAAPASLVQRQWRMQGLASCFVTSRTRRRTLLQKLQSSRSRRTVTTCRRARQYGKMRRRAATVRLLPPPRARRAAPLCAAWCLSACTRSSPAAAF